jgi:hypothetical protein
MWGGEWFGVIRSDKVLLLACNQIKTWGSDHSKTKL